MQNVSFTQLVRDIIHKVFAGDEKRASNLIIEKDLQGEWRWFAWVSNKWQDEEEEILTDAAHVEFIQWLNAHPDQAPELWTWHVKGTQRENRADWWDYAHGFLMFSGVLTAAEAKAFTNADNKEPIGMSHGFYVLQKTGKYIQKYRTFEVSELPLSVAANQFTEFTIIGDMQKMFTARQRSYLVERFGEEKVLQLEGSTEDREKALTEMGVEWKALADEMEAEIFKAEKAAILAEAEAMAKNIVPQVLEALKLDELKTALKTLNERIEANKAALATLETIQADIEALKATEDEKVAAVLTPNNWNWDLSVQNTKANDTAPEAETIVADAEAKNQTVPDWLNNLKG